MRDKQEQSWSILTRVCFWLFLLSVPLVVYGFNFGPFNLRFNRILLIITDLAILFEMSITDNKLRLNIITFDYIVFIFFLCALTTIFRINNSAGFISKFFGLCECILILYTVRAMTRERKDFNNAIIVYLCSSILVFLASTYQFYNVFHGNFDVISPVPFPSIQLSLYDSLTELGYFGGVVDGFTRISSTFGEPNMLAGYCASLLPFAFIGLIDDNISIRSNRMLYCFYCFTFLALLTTNLATVSKTGIIGIIIGISSTVSLSWRAFSRKQIMIITTLVILIAIIAAVYVVLSWDLFIIRAEAGDSGHLSHRLRALHDYWENPILGVGYGQYKRLSAHTIVLTALIELGFLGGILTLLISLQPLLAAQSIRKNPDLHLAAAYGSLLSLVFGFYSYDFFIHVFSWVGMAFFISIYSTTKAPKAKHAQGLL